MKTIKSLDIIKSIRKQWDFNPSPRIVTSKKVYIRKPKFIKAVYDV